VWKIQNEIRRRITLTDGKLALLRVKSVRTSFIHAGFALVGEKIEFIVTRENICCPNMD
jgi:hypothetical protein